MSNAELIMTVEEMAKDKSAWLKARQLGIGGSDAAVIVGLNKWKSPFELWAEKTGQTEAPDLSDNEAVYWGKTLEDAVANRFCELTGKVVRRCGLMQNKEHRFMLASVDRLVVGEDAGLECKTTNAWLKDEWAGDNVPDAYYIQCQWYMAVTGLAKWYIACLIGGNRFVWKEIPRNDGDIAKLIKAGENFWHLVLKKEMPEVDGTDGCSEILAKRYKPVPGSQIDLPSDAAGYAAKVLSLSVTIKEYEEAKKFCENTLQSMLGSAEVGFVDKYTVTWKEVAGRTTIDTKKLSKEQPAIYEQYKKVGKPSHRFSVKEKENE